MTKRNKLIILSVALVVIVVALIGTSYAYFTSEVTGDTSETVITSGTMRLEFSDGPEITLNNAIPGDSVTKTFSVENTGTVETKYDIYFSELCNIFVDKTDLVYTIRHTSANGYELLTETEVPSTSSKIIDSQSIAPNETQTYEITIKFLNKNENQDDNQGAYFSTKLNINDYKNAEHCSKYNNTVKYYVNNVEVQDIPSNIGYLYSTSNCTNNAEVTWNNEQWDYAVDYDSSTADSVCSINFIPEEYTITYNLDGGTNNSSNPSSYTIESDTITLSNPTKEGYTFNGWTGDNTTIAKGSTGNKTYTATWTASTYTLTLNPNNGTYNGTTANSTKTMTYGTKNNNSIGTPTRSGYTFDGWYTSSSGGTQVYNSSGNNVNASTYWTAAYSTGTWKYTDNLTLFAHWTSTCNDGISSVNGTKSFDYTGSVQTFNACPGRTYKLEVWGAQGGSGSSVGGYGGYSYGELSSNSVSTLYIYIGGQGIVSSSTINGGYNGGGYTSQGSAQKCGSGGGATHVSIYNCGELKNCSSYKSSILIVAGGGGGSGYAGAISGNGGGIQGSEGTYSKYISGGGHQTGTNTSSSYHNSSSSTSAAFGLGGSNNGNTSGGWIGGGGGGGWYGGGQGGAVVGGGGGSGYIGNSLLTNKGMYMYTTGCTSSTATDTKTTCTSNTGHAVSNYANTGNGYARIKRLS